MNPQLRRARHEDAAGIIEAHRRSIREICRRDYSQAQVDAWAGRDFQEERWHQAMDRDMVWVISDDKNNIYGFCHLQKKEGAANLAGLYFAPEVTGQGHGKEAMRLALEECRKCGLARIDLLSTKTAKSFYEHHGFKQDGEATLTQMGAEQLECYKMTLQNIS